MPSKPLNAKSCTAHHREKKKHRIPAQRAKGAGYGKARQLWVGVAGSWAGNHWSSPISTRLLGFIIVLEVLEARQRCAFECFLMSRGPERGVYVEYIAGIKITPFLDTFYEWLNATTTPVCFALSRHFPTDPLVHAEGLGGEESAK